MTPPPVRVHLTPVQQRRGEAVGRERQRIAAESGWTEEWGCVGDPVEWHLAGACAEFAVAIAACRVWEPSLMPDTGDGDVGRVQVRSTCYATGHLLLHDRVWKGPRKGWRGDRDDHAFVLVTGVRPALTIRGWILCRDGKAHPLTKIKALQKDRPCHCVPQAALRPFLDKRPNYSTPVAEASRPVYRGNLSLDLSDS